MLHNLRMFDWNDLRYFLAVAQHGSTRAAARALGVNQSTVHRRLLELERRLGHALVRRHPTGYRLTELGETLRPAIERVDEAVAGVERVVRDYGNTLVGTIRLTCPEPLVSRIASSPLLDLFHERHPGLRVELVMSDGYLDLSKGEADIALRSRRTCRRKPGRAENRRFDLGGLRQPELHPAQWQATSC